MENLNELQEFIKDANNAKAFNEFIKSQGYETPDEIQGLKNKNRELILAEKEWKKKFETTQNLLDEIDMDEYNKYKSKASGKAGINEDAVKLQRELEKQKKQIEDILKEKEDFSQKYQNNLKLTKLNEALDQNGFDAKHKELLISAYQGKAIVEDDNIIIDGGTLGQLPANEFFKKYATTEQGKSYLRVPENRGAGSRSFDGKGGKGTMTRDEFMSLNETEKSTAVKEFTIID